MKTAVGILSLVWVLVVFFQSCAAGMAGSLGRVEVMAQAGAVGFVIGAGGLLLGGAFAFKLPLISAIVLLIGGGLLLLDSSSYSDLQVHAYIMILLGALSAIAFHLDRKKNPR